MWLFLPTAMVSIVAHRTKPQHLLVRARLRGDLERLFPGCTVQRTPGADYRFRACIHRNDVARVVSQHLLGMQYDNVKNAIPHGAPVHELRHRFMSEVWRAGMRAQIENAGGKVATLQDRIDADDDRLPWDDGYQGHDGPRTGYMGSP
jgi:hypothetical protein